MPTTVSADRVMQVPAAEIFAFLQDPRNHVRMDGSDQVRGVLGSDRLTAKGDTFWMRMHWILPYVIKNTVVEFEPDRLIAWRHFSGHRWRYALEPLGDATTRVTETFDISRVSYEPYYRRLGFPDRYREVLPASLEKLEGFLVPAA